MASASVATPDSNLSWELPSRGRVGMYSLIAAEAAIFVILVVAYLFYVGKSVSGPTPAILSLPVFISVCLLSSSLSIHFAVSALRGGKLQAFFGWWLLTLVLGAIFLGGTAREWRHLIYQEGLTHRHQPLRHHLLLAGGAARAPRHRGALAPRGCGPLRPLEEGATGARWEGGRPVSVLALRGRGVGGGVHRRLRHRALRRSHGA